MVVGEGHQAKRGTKGRGEVMKSMDVVGWQRERGWETGENIVTIEVL